MHIVHLQNHIMCIYFNKYKFNHEQFNILFLKVKLCVKPQIIYPLTPK